MMLLQRHALIYVALVITSILTNNGHYAYADTGVNLGNLGTMISQRVAQQMSRVTNQLNHRLANIRTNLQERMSTLNQQLRVNMQGIRQNVQDNLSGLRESIEERVQESLAPVNAMMIRSSMAQGIGGLTIVVYGGSTQRIVIDGSPYTCDGEMVNDTDSDTGIRCTTDLVFHQPTDSMDVCTATSYARVNNLYCFGSYASFTCINNACRCPGGVMHTLDNLQNMCGPEYGTNTYVKYDYYPNRDNANHIPIPHPNKYVTCENEDENHCVWYSDGFHVARSEYNRDNL